MSHDPGADPPRRALVTGGAGFLGSHLCEALLARGYDVVCVDNMATGSRHNVAHLADRAGFRWVDCDIVDGLDVSGEVSLVMHLASPASPIDYLRLPVETLLVGSHGTLHALNLARRHHARFVLASTSEVYGDPLQHPQREDYWGNVNPVGPRGVYDEAKRYAEALTTAYRSAYDVNTGIARIFNSYGPRMRPDDGRAVPTFIRQALAGEPMTVAGAGSQTRSLCYVDDTVRGLVALAEHRTAGPVNIGNPAEVTVLDLATRVRDIVGADVPIERIPLPQDDPKVRRPDITRANALLGWSPRVPLDEGLRRTVDWFRQTSTG